MPPPADGRIGTEGARTQRILVTNDDGIMAPGLHALVLASTALAANVMVVAPRHDESGCGAAIGPLRPGGSESFEPVTLPGLEDVLAFRTDCTPALAVLSTCLAGGENSPDIVLSGVNAGLNVGLAVLHSGTVGAALTAANLGLPAIAVSLDAGRGPHWRTAAAVAVAAVRWLSANRLPVTLNINVPDVALEELAGVRAANLGRFARPQVVPSRARPLPDADLDSDAALVRRRFATVTVLHGLREAGYETGAAAASYVETTLSDNFGLPSPLVGGPRLRT